MRRVFSLIVVMAALSGCAASPAPTPAWAGPQRTAVPPVFSPDGNRYFVALPAGSNNVFEIWKRDDTTQALEWAYSWEEAGRDAPASINTLTPSWKYPGRIDLSFSDAIRSRWTGTLTLDEEGWHLRTGKITITP